MAWEPKENVIAPPDFDESVLYAVRAFLAGTANQGQQQTVCAWLEYVCGMKDQPFRPGGEDGRRATDFACGKRWVFEWIDFMQTPTALDMAKKIEAAKIAKSKTKDR